MTRRDLCERCGRPVPARRRGSLYCTDRCGKLQEEADRESWELERQQSEEEAK